MRCNSPKRGPVKVSMEKYNGFSLHVDSREFDSSCVQYNSHFNSINNNCCSSDKAEVCVCNGLNGVNESHIVQNVYDLINTNTYMYDTNKTDTDMDAQVVRTCDKTVQSNIYDHWHVTYLMECQRLDFSTDSFLYVHGSGNCEVQGFSG